MIRNLLLSSPRKARDAAYAELRRAWERRDSRRIHTAQQQLGQATAQLLEAERRWGWVRV